MRARVRAQLLINEATARERRVEWCTSGDWVEAWGSAKASFDQQAPECRVAGGSSVDVCNVLWAPQALRNSSSTRPNGIHEVRGVNSLAPHFAAASKHEFRAYVRVDTCARFLRIHGLPRDIKTIQIPHSICAPKYSVTMRCTIFRNGASRQPLVNNC